MPEPKNIAGFAPDYNPDAWKAYTIEELGQWVHLLTKRATHRSNPEKRAKDLRDAQNYLNMLQSKLDELREDLASEPTKAR